MNSLETYAPEKLPAHYNFIRAGAAALIGGLVLEGLIIDSPLNTDCGIDIASAGFLVLGLGLAYGAAKKAINHLRGKDNQANIS